MEREAGSLRKRGDKYTTASSEVQNIMSIEPMLGAVESLCRLVEHGTVDLRWLSAFRKLAKRRSIG